MPMINDYYKQLKTHIISTQRERLTYGFRVPEYKTHDGMDFTDVDRLELKQNVNILAFEDGIVAAVWLNSASIGNAVDILHEFNEKKFLTRYMHMKKDSVCVKKRVKVKKGDVLGVMGTTGNSTGVHLHFAVKENSTYFDNGTYVNPEPYLTGAKSMRTTTAPTPAFSAIKVGDKVKLNSGARTYDGGSLASFVFYTAYDVIQISSDRAVIGLGKTITAAVKVSDLTKV